MLSLTEEEQDSAESPSDVEIFCKQQVLDLGVSVSISSILLYAWLPVDFKRPFFTGSFMHLSRRTTVSLVQADLTVLDVVPLPFFDANPTNKGAALCSDLFCLCPKRHCKSPYGL